jgi:putative ABC transport system permease protein
MLRNYFTIAVRNLVNHKLYSAINVLGLAIGLACCILIALFVRNELSYDQQWQNADSLWRIGREFKARSGNPALNLATIAPQAGPLMKEDFAEVQEMGRIMQARVLVSRDENAYYEPAFGAVDNSILSLFDFDFISGDPATALSQPFQLVLTENIARKYFGDEDPMGQTLTLENQVDLKVTGIIRDLPETTHLAVDIFASLNTFTAMYGDGFLDNWGRNSFHTYVKLPAGYDIENLKAQLPDFYVRHIDETAPEWTEFHPVRVADIHLHSNRDNEQKTNGSIGVVYTFSAIAIFVLLIACINFMNLSAARSLQRAKEVGMRKVVGAERPQLIAQFLGESILLCSIAALFAVALVELILPAFSTFIDAELTFDYLGDPLVGGSLIALVLLVGVVAGSYPAFYLSSFTPASVLKGEVTRGQSGAFFRKALVVVQFAISITLIVATGIVFAQMRFARDLDLGLNEEHVIVFDSSPTGGLGEAYEAMKQEWLKHPEVVSVTASNMSPSEQNTNGLGVKVEDGDPDGQGLPFLLVDYDFFETYEIEMLAGRSFSQDFATDRAVIPTAAAPQTTGNYIVSELTAKQFGWTPNEAVGKWFELSMCTDCDDGAARGLIVGVVSDIHFSSIREAIKPVFYVLPPPTMFGFPSLGLASVRVTGRDLEATLASMDATWTKFQPDQPVQRSFQDENFAALYEQERQQGKVFMYFSLLAIFIASLGLFGLASFTTEQRTKEIGVRKVMGGSVWDIVKLLTWDFSKLVLLANVIAWPTAWFAMDRWLSNFAYRIDIGLVVFLGAAVIALLVAWLTVGGLAARAASARPIMALRYE